MRISIPATILLLVTVAVYAPAAGFPFVYEDHRDPQITLDVERLVNAMWLQPLRSVTTAVRLWELGAFGLDAWGFHVGGVIWHGVAVVLLLALAWQVLTPWAAVTAAGVFALHPIQVEAVAYVSARADVISTVALLLALLAASLGSMAGAVVGVVVASLAKESAVVAWALVPVWAAWTSAPFPVRRWCLLAAGVAGVAAWWVPRQISGLAVVIDPVLIGTQLTAVWRLLAVLVLPWGLTIDHDWAAIAWLWPAALVASLAATAWALLQGWERRSWLALAWLWTLICLGPRLIVPLYEGLHERHFYPVVVGWCLCAGHWWTKHAQWKAGCLSG